MVKVFPLHTTKPHDGRDIAAFVLNLNTKLSGLLHTLAALSPGRTLYQLD